MLTEASGDWYTPEVLAQKLSIFTGRKFSEAEMLPYAHAMIDLPDDDPRRERLGLAGVFTPLFAIRFRQQNRYMSASFGIKRNR